MASQQEAEHAREITQLWSQLTVVKLQRNKSLQKIIVDAKQREADSGQALSSTAPLRRM
jgi:hypothetical protein